MTLIAIHLLQNHAPSNLNRDDNGDPKDSFFGGVRRARISSQALKRSIRVSKDFTEYFEGREELLATRSQLANHIDDYLKRQQDSIPPLDRLTKPQWDLILKQAARLGKSGKPSKTIKDADDESEAETSDTQQSTKAQLMFLTPLEVAAVAARMIELCRQETFEVVRKKKPVKAKFADLSPDELRNLIGEEYCPHSVDIALFGRMITSSTFKDMDGAVYSAHPISTHTIEQEYDF